MRNARNYYSWHSAYNCRRALALRRQSGDLWLGLGRWRGCDPCTKSAREQVRVAERKIFLDLLDRRIGWYTETRQIIKRYYDFINADIDEAKLGRNGFEYRKWFYAINEQKLSVQWLFGEDVEQSLENLGNVLDAFGVARKNLVKTANDISLSEINLANGQPVEAAYCESHDNFLEAVNKLHMAVTAYIYVGDVKHFRRKGKLPDKHSSAYRLTLYAERPVLEE